MRRSLVVLVAFVAALPLLGRALVRLREPDPLTLPAGVAGRFLDVEGGRVHVVERGTGPALLLVHGFGASTWDWEEHAMAALAEDHHAIAVDLWGMGFSERRADIDPSFSTYAEELRAVLDALGIERAAVAGHSLGGAVAAVLGARHPERVDRLVLVAALARSDPPWIFRAMHTPVVGDIALGLVANLAPPGAPPDYRARMALVSRIQGTRHALLRYVRRPGKFDELDAAYERIHAPMLLLHGTLDASVPYAAMERAAGLVRDARVVRLDGKGHWLLWECPDVVVREMRAFL